MPTTLESVTAAIERSGVVAVIRMKDPDKVQAVVDAIAAGGVKTIEVTMTVPGAVELIRTLAPRMPEGFVLGAGTVLDAWDAGADIVKVFPATALGPGYIKDVRAPLPQVKLMPTGGVTVENAGEWIAAGAVAVGVGSALLDTKAIDAGDYAVLRSKAERIVVNVNNARAKPRT